MKARTSPLGRRDRGFALLALIGVLIVALTVAIVVRLSVNDLVTARVLKNNDALARAGEALQGFALQTLPPGTLPCPDVDGDGIGDSALGGCQAQRGLLPVRSLNIDQLTDASGAPLWYAVELAYVGNAAAPRNPSRGTLLTVDGRASAAVIIAPGPPIDGQGRSPLNVTDFLEGVNADADQASYQTLVADSGNDQLHVIETGGFWTHMARRTLAEAAGLLEDYRTSCGEYPWAAPFGGPYNSSASQQIGALPLTTALPFNWGAACPFGTAPTPPAWLATHWDDQFLYRMCTAAQGSCLTVTGDSAGSGSAVLLSPGVPLSGQVRPSSMLNNYFEGDNTAAPDDTFAGLNIINHTASYNDVTNLRSP